MARPHRRPDRRRVRLVRPGAVHHRPDAADGPLQPRSAAVQPVSGRHAGPGLQLVLPALEPDGPAGAAAGPCPGPLRRRPAPLVAARHAVGAVLAPAAGPVRASGRRPRRSGPRRKEPGLPAGGTGGPGVFRRGAAGGAAGAGAGLRRRAVRRRHGGPAGLSPGPLHHRPAKAGLGAGADALPLRLSVQSPPSQTAAGQPGEAHRRRQSGLCPGAGIAGPAVCVLPGRPVRRALRRRGVPCPAGHQLRRVGPQRLFPDGGRDRRQSHRHHDRPDTLPAGGAGLDGPPAAGRPAVSGESGAAGLRRLADGAVRDGLRTQLQALHDLLGHGDDGPVPAGGPVENPQPRLLLLPSGVPPGPGRVAGHQLRSRGWSGGEEPGRPVSERGQRHCQRPLSGLLPVLRHPLPAGAAGQRPVPGRAGGRLVGT